REAAVHVTLTDKPRHSRAGTIRRRATRERRPRTVNEVDRERGVDERRDAPNGCRVDVAQAGDVGRAQCVQGSRDEAERPGLSVLTGPT
ncbi:hypothetical protein CR079_27230, partial [Salmonella enterica subsp. enterica serovar Typhimurium]